MFKKKKKKNITRSQLQSSAQNKNIETTRAGIKHLTFSEIPAD